MDLGACRSWIVLSGHSTNSNTTLDTRRPSILERVLGHRCHCSTCNIHTGELPLNLLIAAVDGPTTAKDGFQGTIGKFLSKLKEMEFNVAFGALMGGE